MSSEFFIKRPIFATVCSLLFIVAGIACIPLLPIAQFPEIAPSQISVSSAYLGASAETVESAVTIPIEQEINGLEGARYITSTSSSTGTSTINITLEPERDVEQAIVDVQNRLKSIEGRLPDEVRKDGVAIRKNSDAMVLALAMYSENGKYDKFFISNYARRSVAEALRRIKGVGSVMIFGDRKYSMRIWLQPDKLASHGLTPTDVSNALQEQNVQVSAGKIGQPPYVDDQAYQMNIEARGRLKNPEEFANVIIKTSSNGAVTKIGDVARVEIGAQSYSTMLHFNGNENVVGMIVYQLPGANAIEVGQALEEELERLSEKFPKGLSYKVAFNTTNFISDSIKEVVRTLILAIGFVILVIYVFLGSGRSTLIPAITIPVSLLGTFLFVKLFGFSINTLTLFGLTLATGLVVDDAIVVLENIDRLMKEKNLKPIDASIASMKEISGAVIATSLVLIAVFVPVAFFPGATGKMYQQFALTIAFSIAISSFVALTLSPALSAIILKNKAKKNNRFFEWFDQTLSKSKRKYRSLLISTFRQQPFVLGGFVICLLFTFLLYKFVPGSFVPTEDQSYFIVALKGPSGSSLAKTIDTMETVEALLLKDPDIENLFAMSGFSFLGSGPNQAILFPILKPLDKRSGKSHSLLGVINRITPQLNAVPGALVFAFPPPSIRGLGSFGGFTFEVKAEGTDIDLSSLDKYIKEFSAKANQQAELMAVFSSYTADDPLLVLDVDRERAKRLGVSLTEIFRTLQISLGAQYINDFDLGDRVYRVYVQADKSFRSKPEDINELYVRSEDGKMIPMGNLISFQESTSPQNIKHFNLFRSATVNGSAGFGKSLAEAIATMEKVSKEVFPKGLTYEWSGIAREQIQSGNQSSILFVLGLVLVFLALAAQYESFRDPLIIMLSVPLAIFGGMLAQFVRGLENDVFCQIGLVMLIGMASKNAILIVEYANQLKDQGFKPLRAVIQSCISRFRPILMTSFSFILGILPLVFANGAGASGQHSLGTVVFGGMLIATILSLFVVPVFYILITRKEGKAKSI